MAILDCEQSLFCSKIRRETRKEELETGELKRLTPAPRTTHWPQLHGLPYGLLHGLPYGLPLRTTLKNQPNSFYGVQKYKKLTSSSYTIITARKTAAIFSFYISRSSLFSSLDGRKIQKSCLLANVNVDGKRLRQITKINIQQRLPIVHCAFWQVAGRWRMGQNEKDWVEKCRKRKWRLFFVQLWSCRKSR